MQGIMGKSNFLINNLQNLLHSFQLEDQDDQKCRNRYKDKWFREPSLKLNYQMVQAAQQYIKTIQQTQAFDQQASDEISVGAENFQELSLPLLQLNKNIPIENRVVEENPSEKQVKAEILKLYELSDKCTEIIRPIFALVNEDSNLVDEFMDVLKRKETEQSIYEKHKAVYLAKFAELQKVSDEVKKQEEVITEFVKNNGDKLMPKINEYEQNRIYDFDNYSLIGNIFDELLGNIETIDKSNLATESEEFEGKENYF
jgi:energy-converting hydrogenase A subunit M